MLFNSIEFIFLYLPAVVIIFYIFGTKGHKKSAIVWLVLSSLFFYGWWNPAYLILLIGSIIFNYNMGYWLSKNSSKLLLSVGIIVNLGVLAYFKYSMFFIENLNNIIGTEYNFIKIILPLAISFFTFQQISYLVDSYKNIISEKSFLNYSLFVTFFPQLIAGPIVHHKEMLPQFLKNSIYKLNLININLGLAYFIIGLFKKVILADSVAEYSTPIFVAVDNGATVSFFEAWGGALSYSLQLYFDFSGYADMAIGIALMFGIILPLNFNSPYKSSSIIDFWRRWHITLSRFLRDYLYIPLGGNRKGSKKINILITMLLGGFWHGASWNFILWGGLHGVYLIINHIWRKFKQKILKNNINRSFSGVSIIFTFLVVVIAWVFFRAETMAGALSMLSGMFGLNGFILPNILKGITPEFLLTHITFDESSGIGILPTISIPLIFILLVIVFFAPNTKAIIGMVSLRMKKKSVIIPLVLGALLFISIKTLFVSNSEFLYFNF